MTIYYQSVLMSSDQQFAFSFTYLDDVRQSVETLNRLLAPTPSEEDDKSEMLNEAVYKQLWNLFCSIEQFPHVRSAVANFIIHDDKLLYLHPKKGRFIPCNIFVESNLQGGFPSPVDDEYFHPKCLLAPVDGTLYTDRLGLLQIANHNNIHDEPGILTSFIGLLTEFDLFLITETEYEYDDEESVRVFIQYFGDYHWEHREAPVSICYSQDVSTIRSMDLPGTVLIPYMIGERFPSFRMVSKPFRSSVTEMTSLIGKEHPMRFFYNLDDASEGRTLSLNFWDWEHQMNSTNFMYSYFSHVVGKFEVPSPIYLMDSFLFKPRIQRSFSSTDGAVIIINDILFLCTDINYEYVEEVVSCAKSESERKIHSVCTERNWWTPDGDPKPVERPTAPLFIPRPEHKWYADHLKRTDGQLF